MRRLWLGIGIIVTLWVAAELFLPGIIARQLEAGMVQTLGAQQASVRVATWPALRMLAGQFATLVMDAHELKSGKITVSQVSLVLKDAVVDVPALAGRKQLVLKDIGHMDGTVILTEANIHQYLSQALRGVRDVSVGLAPGKMQVGGALAVGPVMVNINLEGHLAANNTQVKFVTEKLLVNNALVSANFAGNMLAEIPLFDLEQLPFPVTFREVKIDQGRVVIRVAR